MVFDISGPKSSGGEVGEEMVLLCVERVCSEGGSIVCVDRMC